jgi:hypothetical protein
MGILRTESRVTGWEPRNPKSSSASNRKNKKTSKMTYSRLIGRYRAETALLPHHNVSVEENDDHKLVWKPDGDSKGWILTVSPENDALLLVGEDCPHHEECKQVIVELEDDKVIALRFNGELYMKKDMVFEVPDNVYKHLDDDDDGEDDSERAVGEFGSHDSSADD